MRINYILCSIFSLTLVGCASYHGSGTGSSTVDGMVLIPAGEFTIGSNKEDNLNMWRETNALNPYGFNDQMYVNEYPAHKVSLPAFLIDQYEVTNTQFRDFAMATQHSVPLMWPRNGYNYSNKFLAALSLDDLRLVASNNFKLDIDVTVMSKEALLAEMEKIQAVRDTHPVTAVTWSDAVDYCAWAGKRLPTEAEWEKAARGPKGNEYPWGNKWDAKKINTTSDDPDAPYLPIGSYPTDKSVYGVYDMAGNVAEWVTDWYDAYPDAPQSNNKLYGRKHRVVRGGMTSSGHYDSLSVVFRSAKRTHLGPYSALLDLGFRCAKDVQ